MSLGEILQKSLAGRPEGAPKRTGKELCGVWYRLMRPPFFITAAIPVCVALGFVMRAGYPLDSALWLRFAGLLLGCFCGLTIANLANELFDYVLGTDAREESIGGTGAIQSGLVSCRELFLAILFFVAVTIAIGLGLILSLPEGLHAPLILLTLFAVASAIFYVAPPIRYGYRGLGEVMVGINMGFIIVGASSVILAGTFELRALALALPVAGMVAGILYYQSLPEIETDLAAGKHTLANILGNLVNRTISMSNKYFGGVVSNGEVVEPVDRELRETAVAAAQKASDKMDELRVADAITEIFNLFKRCNKYIDETMPWALAKDESKKGRLATVLYNLVEAISIGACLLEPFMPETSAKILSQLGAKKRSLEVMNMFGLYQSGTKVTDKPEILFARLDVNEVLAKVEAKKEAEAEAAGTAGAEENGNADAAGQDGNGAAAVIDIEAKPEITFEDFAKLQFQVGEIIACEAVKKSKKLLCSQVRVGSQVRQIVSGIKAHYTPEEMVGKKVMVVVNLKPAKLAGVLSEGMLLCAAGRSAF